MNSKKTATCAVLLLVGTMAQSAVSPVLPIGVDAVQVGTAQDIGERQSLLIEMDRLAELAPAPADGATVAESGQLSEEFDGLVAEAAPTKRKRMVKKPTSGSTVPSSTSSAAAPRVSAIKREEDRARQAVRRGDYPEATKLFFNLLDKETNPARVLQIRFILGRTLQEMGLHQVSAFPYYEIVRTEVKKNPKNKYVRQSLERLTVAADALDSDILLSYAVRLIDEDDFPAGNRDMLFYRRGEVRFREGNFIEAAKEFNRVRGNSVFHDRARYRLGLSLVEAGQLEKAEQVFASTAEAKSTTDVTNRARVNAMLGRARTLYQRKLFAEAIDAYREIPRDTEQWHDALFEVSWAYLQDGRFRSALSNFHSLHSPFYEEFYQPESLLLRAIVYHYICRYDEMEKTLGIFERIYGPVQKELRNVLGGNMSPIALYREIRKVDENFDLLKRTGKRQLAIPFLVARQVLREGDVRRSLSYIRALEREKKKIEQAPATWRDARVGRYAKRVVERRMEATQVAVGRLILRHLTRLQDELAGHMEQAGLVRIDMISGKKEAVKKEIAGKGIVRESVDQEQDRSYYVQNGYDYWPFTGEYWLDEIGNYHYVGVKACE